MPSKPAPHAPDRLNFARSAGFTLLELMIVVAVVAILARISFNAYTRSVTKSRRVAAEACLASYASYMERFYTTNLRYDQDTSGTAMSNAVLAAQNMPCANATTGTGQYYTYSFAATPTQTAYQVQAAPAGSQSTLDAACGTLSVDQTGSHAVSGSSPVSSCWPQ
jgi:type IV pilus assembly protein PilE